MDKLRLLFNHTAKLHSADLQAKARPTTLIKTIQKVFKILYKCLFYVYHAFIKLL